MDSTVSFVLSLLALAASGVALFFTWRFQPRSHLEWFYDDTRVTRFDDERVPIVNYTLTNIGNATARDVRVTIDLATRVDHEPWGGVLLLESGKQLIIGVPLLRVERQANGELKRQDVDDKGAWISTTLQPVVTVTWRRDWGKGTQKFKVKIVGKGY